MDSNLFYKGFYEKFKDKTWELFIASLFKKRHLFLVDLLKRIIFENKSLFNSSPSQSYLLDLGCGSGELTKKISEIFNIEAIGVEINKQFIKGSSPSYMVADSSLLPFKAKSFFLITAISLFEHIPKKNRQIFIKNIKKILKKDGIFIIQIPNRFFPIEQHTFLPLVGYLPSKFHDLFYFSYLNVPSEHEITKTLINSGFTILKILKYGIPFSRVLRKNFISKVIPFGFIFVVKKVE